MKNTYPRIHLVDFSTDSQGLKTTRKLLVDFTTSPVYSHIRCS